MLSPGSVSDSHRFLCPFLLAPDSSPEAANQVSVLPGKASLLDMGGGGAQEGGFTPELQVISPWSQGKSASKTQSLHSSTDSATFHELISALPLAFQGDYL